MKVLLAIAVLLVVEFGWPALLAAENLNGNEVENEIWALEEEYVTAFKNADHRKILDFYHQNFLGWPDSQDSPAGKSEAEKFLKEHYPLPVRGNFQIDRAGIRVFGDVVMTQYVLNVSMQDADGDEKTHSTRITHTWQKDGTRWLILGGMSNQQQAMNPEEQD